MIPSAITLKVFGIPMQRRSTRRKLVVATYIVLSSICAATAWSDTIFPAGISYAIWSAIAVGIFRKWREADPPLREG
jgi:multidrug transporter EmrE-like cation transporter